MGAAENKELVRGMFGNVAGEPNKFLDALADDISYTIIGTTKFSGTFKGKDEVVNRLLGPLMASLENGLAITIDNLIADGEYVAMQARGNGVSKSGAAYNNTYCHVFRIVAGKVRQITEYLDTELVTRAFGK